MHGLLWMYQHRVRHFKLRSSISESMQCHLRASFIGILIRSYITLAHRSMLMTARQEHCSGRQLIWNGAVTTVGKLMWQNTYNASDMPFADAELDAALETSGS